MTARTELTWTYKPETYFEVQQTIQISNGVLTAENGTAVLALYQFENPLTPQTRQNSIREVTAAFQVHQIQTHERFELTGPNEVQHQADGRTTRTLSAEAGVYLVKGSDADFVLTNAEGEIVRDTRAERIDSRDAVMKAVMAKVGLSETLRGMLTSFQNAINDPDNELHHLYEIRDAAVKVFGGKAKVIKRLRLTEKEFDVLGILGNIKRLRQGRHRGQGVERDATMEELTEARRIARLIIERFAATV